MYVFSKDQFQRLLVIPEGGSKMDKLLDLGEFRLCSSMAHTG